MSNTKEVYRASVAFSADAIKLEPIGKQALAENESVALFEKVKTALNYYGCALNDYQKSGTDPKEYLSGESSINWKLEDESRGLCCDGSKPQVVCEVDLNTGVTTCWAECPDAENAAMRVKFGPGSKGVSY